MQNTMSLDFSSKRQGTKNYWKIISKQYADHDLNTCKVSQELELHFRGSCIHKIQSIYLLGLSSFCEKSDKNNFRIVSKQYAHLQTMT